MLSCIVLYLTTFAQFFKLAVHFSWSFVSYFMRFFCVFAPVYHESKGSNLNSNRMVLSTHMDVVTVLVHCKFWNTDLHRQCLLFVSGNKSFDFSYWTKSICLGVFTMASPFVGKTQSPIETGFNRSLCRARVIPLRTLLYHLLHAPSKTYRSWVVMFTIFRHKQRLFYTHVWVVLQHKFSISFRSIAE